MKLIKLIPCLILALALAISFIGCDEEPNPPAESSGLAEQTPAESTPDATPEDPTVLITLTGSGYTASKTGVVSVSGNVLTITAAGTYKITGTLDDAQIRVSVEKTDIVDLIFAGVNITNKSSAPLYIESADKVSIELEAGTENVLTDAKTYILPQGEDKPNACIYSSEDLTIKGEGTLTVNANYNNGIGTKNDLKIKSGNITVNAANNALKGNQSVKIEGGNITLAGADGIKSDSLVEGEGTIQILGGTVDIKAGDDGIQAVTDITITENATVTVNAADKDVNSDGTTNIAEGALISK
jgi:hypothetical protein